MTTRNFHLPETYTLIFFIIVLMAMLTWIIPSGEFQHREQIIGNLTKQVVIPGTYHTIPKVNQNGHDLRQGPSEVLMAPTKGVQEAAQNIAFVLLVGGTFGIIARTGAIVAGLVQTSRFLKGREAIIIPVAMLLFGIGGTTFGMSEETLPLFIIFISLMMAIGYDSLTGFMIVSVGTHIGFAASTLNPFSVLIAQGIVGIPGNPQLWSSRLWPSSFLPCLPTCQHEPRITIRRNFLCEERPL